MRGTSAATRSFERKGGEMEKSIVCGVDGSRDSEAAVIVAARLAERLGAP
jgi:hypothetical protein